VRSLVSKDQSYEPMAKRYPHCGSGSLSPFEPCMRFARTRAHRWSSAHGYAAPVPDGAPQSVQLPGSTGCRARGACTYHLGRTQVAIVVRAAGIATIRGTCCRALQLAFASIVKAYSPGPCFSTLVKASSKVRIAVQELAARWLCHARLRN
jgi:hypothetical protein